jgi:hypothetical protein
MNLSEKLKALGFGDVVTWRCPEHEPDNEGLRKGSFSDGLGKCDVCNKTNYSVKPYFQKEAHGFAQTDTVKHCPFCGSGDVWGGSDGTITCEFDGATFQVSVEPQFPSAPGNMNGVPLNIEGEPDAMGQADAEEAWTVPEGVSPSSGEDLEPGEEETDEDEEEGGGPPWAKDEDEDNEDEGPAQDEGAGGGVPWKSGSYRTFAGDLLPEDLYLRHLAIRHAEEPQRFLASLRVAAEEEPEEQDREEGTTAGSPRCDVCGKIKRGVGWDRRTHQMMCADCYRASGQKTW